VDEPLIESRVIPNSITIDNKVPIPVQMLNEKNLENSRPLYEVPKNI